MLLAARAFFVLACVNLALHLVELPWLAKQANPVTPAGDLYYQLVRTRDELTAVREQNVMLREMLGAGPLDRCRLARKHISCTRRAVVPICELTAARRAQRGQAVEQVPAAGRSAERLRHQAPRPVRFCDRCNRLLPPLAMLHIWLQVKGL